MLPEGIYSYEIRRQGELLALENSRLDRDLIVSTRRSADRLSGHQVEAVINPERCVERLAIAYSSSLFTRKASYQAVQDNLRGRISGLAGPGEVAVKLGRFREIDAAAFLIFRALTISHVQMRGDQRWTGRVAVIDANTLAAASLKHSCARQDSSGNLWLYEPRMGDIEHIELDEAGRIVSWRDSRGVSATLTRTGTCS